MGSHFHENHLQAGNQTKATFFQFILPPLPAYEMQLLKGLVLVCLILSFMMPPTSEAIGCSACDGSCAGDCNYCPGCPPAFDDLLMARGQSMRPYIQTSYCQRLRCGSSKAGDCNKCANRAAVTISQ